jgi:hypothetical protein
LRGLLDQSHLNLDQDLAQSQAVQLSQIRYENVRLLNDVKSYENLIKNYNDILFLMMNYPDPYENIFSENEREKIEFLYENID